MTRKSFRPRRHRASAASTDDGTIWLYGRHPVEAALANPARVMRELVATREALASLPDPRRHRPDLAIRVVDRAAIAEALPPGTVHQGLAALAEPLPSVELDDVLGDANQDARTIVVLDHVTDPRNVGAILRSAAAFGARAVVVTERVTARAAGVLAKAASGALDRVPLVAVVNLARALDRLKKSGYWCVGLDAEGERDLADELPGRSVALVLGAEGEGLRRLTRERCDLIARLPTQGEFTNLNVSNAAAVALYVVTSMSRPASDAAQTARRSFQS